MADEILARAVQSHGIAVEPATLESSLADSEHGPALATWATVHLTRDTLLSPDEHDLYKALERSGRAEKFAASGTTDPLSHDDIQLAIEELNRSTEAVSKQTETLRQQQDALARLVNANGKAADARADINAKQMHRWEAKRKQLSTEVEELSQDLDFRLADLEQQGKAQGEDLHSMVTRLLESDDKLLSSLQKLGWELETEHPDEKDQAQYLRDLCARMIKFTVETIRTKLDRLYLEALVAAVVARKKDSVADDEVSALQEELESLYAEILPVAQMSVEQQHLEPASKSLTGKRGQRMDRSAEAVGYIEECLDFLLERMESLLSHIEAFRAHQTATATMSGAARAELAVRISAAKKGPRRPANVSPTRRRKSSGHASGSSPVRTRTTPGGRRRSSGAATSDLPPLDQLLQSLALLLPEEADSKAQAAVLAATLAERSEKAADIARSVQESFEAAASSQLGDMRRALRLVRDSVLAESPFADVQLVDPEIEGSIAVLTQEVGKVNTTLAGIDADLGKARGRSVKRDELISRWGR